MKISKTNKTITFSRNSLTYIIKTSTLITPTIEYTETTFPKIHYKSTTPSLGLSSLYREGGSYNLTTGVAPIFLVYNISSVIYSLPLLLAYSPIIFLLLLSSKTLEPTSLLSTSLFFQQHEPISILSLKILLKDFILIIHSKY